MPHLRLIATVFWVLAATASAATTTSLTVLHTSDLHGSVLPVDDTRNEEIDHSLAHVATLVREIRTSVEHEVLLLDSGDTIQGTPFELFTTVRGGRPSPTIAAMNRIGYQAMAVGNHEFNFGLDVLRRAEAEACFPFLSANTITADNGKPAFAPFEIIEAGAVRIGVLGLTTPNIPGWELPEHYRGLRFEAMDDAARRWVEVLRAEEDCDLVIVLAHTGFERDPVSGAPTGTDHEDFAWRLAGIPGIDLLLTGHAHKDIEPRRLGGTIVSQPAAYARVLTRIDLELERVDGRVALASWRGENIPVRRSRPDPEVSTMFKETHDEVVDALDDPLVRLEGPLDVTGCRLADCAALDLVHRVQFEATGADLSLAAVLSDATPARAAGPLNRRWIYGFYPFPNTLMAVRVTGRQVKDILEHSARYYTGLDCSEGPGCRVLTDSDIARYNVDSMAGLSYRIDPTRPVGEKVHDLEFDGRAFDLHRSFTLACNNYRAAGGGGYPHLGKAEVVWTSATEITELIAAFFEARESWLPAADSNWRIEPDYRENRVEKPLSETP